MLSDRCNYCRLTPARPHCATTTQTQVLLKLYRPLNSPFCPRGDVSNLSSDGSNGIRWSRTSRHALRPLVKNSWKMSARSRGRLDGTYPPSLLILPTDRPRFDQLVSILRETPRASPAALAPDLAHGGRTRIASKIVTLRLLSAAVQSTLLASYAGSIAATAARTWLTMTRGRMPQRLVRDAVAATARRPVRTIPATASPLVQLRLKS